MPGILASIGNLTVFTTICVVCHGVHHLQQLKALLSWQKNRNRYDEDDQMKMKKRKKLIVISGCDRGFGRMLVEELSHSTAEGMYLVLALTLTQEAAHGLLQSTSSSNIYALQCDVTNEKNMKEMKVHVEAILDKENAVLYAIVNNAGIADPGDFAWFDSIATHERVMDVNFFGQLRVTQTLLPFMLRTGRETNVGARIINLSSVCGDSASPSNSGV